MIIMPIHFSFSGIFSLTVTVICTKLSLPQLHSTELLLFSLVKLETILRKTISIHTTHNSFSPFSFSLFTSRIPNTKLYLSSSIIHFVNGIYVIQND